MQVPPGVAAGHPATAEAGLEILAEGGTAVDAAVAAALASCVAETVMTGIAGGGYAVLVEAGSGRAQVLDFFVAVPGLGTAARDARARGAGRSVRGGARALLRRRRDVRRPGRARRAWTSCGAGAGALPWARLVEPALRLARDGLAMPPAHAKCLAMLAPVMTHARGRADLRAGRAAAGGRRPARPAGARGRAGGRRRRGGAHVLRGHARRVAARAHGRARRPRHPGGPGRLPGRVGRARRGRLRGRPRPDARWALAAHRHAGGPSPAERCAAGGPGARPCAPARSSALQREDVRAHDEPLRRRRDRERLRDHDQPRARLGRLPARATTST